MFQLTKGLLVAVLQAVCFLSTQADHLPTFILFKQVGGSACSVTNGGACIEAKDYTSPLQCRWRVNGPVSLTVEYFDLGKGDLLRMNNQKYGGSDGPHNVFLPYDSVINFRGREENVTVAEDYGVGFKVCITPKAFELAESTGCLVTHGGQCIESDTFDIHDYVPAMSCTWNVLRNTALYSHYFLLGDDDHLDVNGESYTYIREPREVTVNASAQIMFEAKENGNTTDNSEFAEGFRICSFPENSVQPIIPITKEEEIVTCISVIDESDIPSFVKLWEDLRTKYPDRPFCLLQPVPTWTANMGLNIPTAFYNDPSLNTFAYIPREDPTGSNPLPPGVVTDPSNWYSICNLEAQKLAGVTKVVVFVDESGSMDRYTVESALDEFKATANANGIEIVSSICNTDEDWVTPCLETSLLQPGGDEACNLFP